MLKTGVAISNKKQGKEAGIDACEKALKKVGNKANLIIVFSSVSYDQKEMLKGVNSIAKKIPVVGCSDSGEITTDGPNSEKVAIIALRSDKINFTIGVGMNANKDSGKAGREAAQKIQEKSEEPPSLFMSFLDGLAENGAEAVRGIQSVLGDNLPIIGGSAGDDFQFEKTYQYVGEKVYENAVVGVGFSGDFSFGVGVKHGWEPIGLPMEVTKSEGSKIIEIDNKPALSIYEDYFGKEAEELTKQPIAQMAYTYPLGMSIEGSEELLIRDVVIANQKGEITCAAEIPQGSEVRLMLSDHDKAVKAAREAAQNAEEQLEKSPKAIFVFNCMARSKLLGNRKKDEIDAIQDVLGKETPLIGFYTYGEQAPLGGKLGPNCFSVFHNETMTLLILSE